MAFDIKGKIDEIVGKIKSDSDLKAKFENDPVSTIEELIGVDLPNDQMDSIVNGIKAKLAMGDIGDKLGGLFKR